ncbi:MAG: preprotein translocase subunit YajC [Bacteroidota bacterium]|nr:preprotein translocase subunit YajC [Bacteroidota bacterium]
MDILTAFAPYLLIFAVFFFLIIRPQQQRIKKEKEFENSLSIGDRIITKSGLHGKIVEIATDSIVIETMSGKLKMERSAVSMELSAKLKK